MRIFQIGFLVALVPVWISSIQAHEDSHPFEGADDEIVEQIKKRLPPGFSWTDQKNESLEQRLWRVIESLERDQIESVSETLYKDILLTAIHDGVRTEFTMERVRSGLENEFSKIEAVVNWTKPKDEVAVIERMNSFTGEKELVSPSQVQREKDARFFSAFSQMYLNAVALYGNSSDKPMLEKYAELNDPLFSHLANIGLNKISQREPESQDLKKVDATPSNSTPQVEESVNQRFPANKSNDIKIYILGALIIIASLSVIALSRKTSNK